MIFYVLSFPYQHDITLLWPQITRPFVLDQKQSKEAF